MRTWRVGTFSMGASLLFLGLFLLFSELLGFKLNDVMMAWWPIILVVLGVEILVFLFFNHKEKPFLKYDILSIFFVGILGTSGIGFAILSSTGVIDKVADTLEREERTMDLPEFSYDVDGEIKRVVVRTEQYPVTIEGTTGKEISMFGTYRKQAMKNETLMKSADEYVMVRKKADTLYIDVKSLPSESGPFSSYGTLSATLLVPSDVELEIIGSDNDITLKTRTLLSNWSVERANMVSVYVPEDGDIKVSADGVQSATGKDWKVTGATQTEEVTEVMQEDTGLKDAVYQAGSGKHKLRITSVYSVSLMTSN